MGQHLVCVGGQDHSLRIPFLTALLERNFRVTAVSSGDGAVFARTGIPHCSYGFDRFTSGRGGWAALGTIKALLSELRPDIVQSFDTKPNVLVPLSINNRVPVVRTVNGLGWTFSSLEPRALSLRPVYCGLQWLASWRTAATVFQNRNDKNFFERYSMVRRGSGHLIRSSGIDVDAFSTARLRGPSGASMREQLGLTSAEIVMFVGRLTRQKGIPTLIKAVPRIIASRPQARIVLVGPRHSEGPFAVDQAELDKHASHVITLGPRQDIPTLLGMADVFAFPTQYREGIPRVLLEAGLAGLPIVASRMPGCNDVVEDGWNGHLVPPHDADALASRVIELLSDSARARAMGCRSIDMVRERFALPWVVDQYVELYTRVLASTHSNSRVRSPVEEPRHRELGEARR
jgi:glycosyltransferase involved in cell wall biosynthesis